MVRELAGGRVCRPGVQNCQTSTNQKWCNGLTYPPLDQNLPLRVSRKTLLLGLLIGYEPTAWELDLLSRS